MSAVITIIAAAMHMSRQHVAGTLEEAHDNPDALVITGAGDKPLVPTPRRSLAVMRVRVLRRAIVLIRHRRKVSPGAGDHHGPHTLPRFFQRVSGPRC